MALTSAQRKDLQRALNTFVEHWVRGGTKAIKVDGVRGPTTRERERDARFWLGFVNERVDDLPENREQLEDFLWQLAHPRRVKPGEDKDRPKRGKQRRKRHRARHQTRLRKAARRRSDRRYGGSRYFTNQAIDLADRKRKGVIVTSRKRPILLGNRASDHNLFNVTADAVDHGLVNDQEFMDMLARHLGGPSDVVDFQNFAVRNPQNGRSYRAQLIAVTHGTGPHHHSGFRRI
jgi:hypothetical protein